MDLQNQNILFEDNDFIFFEYKRSLLNNYIHGIDNMYFQKKVRFLENYIGGGRICYLYSKMNESYAGYCMVTFGRCGRYLYSEKNGMTIGPIYLKKEFRGRRLSILMLEKILEYYGSNKKVNFAYAYIHRINKQSNALFSRVGFTITSNLKVSKMMRLVYKTDEPDTDYRLYEKKLTKSHV